ncbi:PfkB domain-containing protein [Actibacterium atlanticum]|uniref:Ribokinase n=1 Tax=Actibacterium atlanticum TaxID=1461693 RepID=A0A058ZNW6_9RHOB|nr:ribokinase [Actibacterium atlanticum]KCV82521.1 PfkB domain-containing protein [Actibacterium atlanticum]
MAVFNLGSINIDHFYEVAHLPAPGETIAAKTYRTGLGGKGANQSVAAARAGAKVFHGGAVGAGGEWARAALGSFGVDTSNVVKLAEPSGHAVICVDPDAENSIVIVPGANRRLTGADAEAALRFAKVGDVLLLQNETSAQADAARIGREKGLFVIYSAAPFDVRAVQAVLPYIDMLVMNEVEAQQLHEALGAAELPQTVITLGARGAVWCKSGSEIAQPGFEVGPIDTTGAGDCFTGALAAAMDRGLPGTDVLRFAVAASALQVTKPGTAAAMPGLEEIQSFLNDQ